MDLEESRLMLQRSGLHDPALARDGCGIGFLTNLREEDLRRLFEMAVEVLKNLTHRGACGSHPRGPGPFDP